MPSTRVAFAEIESWTPAIDARAVENGSLFVLSGKNYSFKAKGPVSGFGSYVVPGGALESGIYPVQSVDVGTKTVVTTASSVFDRRTDVVSDESEALSLAHWNKLGSFVPDLDSNIGFGKWTSAYVGFGSYICHPAHGIYQVLGDSIAKFEPVGLVDTPMAIAEANGRLVIMGRFQTQWSNSFNAQDLTPELAGAGFQTTAELVPGQPLMLVSFQGGFIVHTTKGVLLFEYVGGDTVFRSDRIPTEHFLLNPLSICQVPSGDSLMVTQQGIWNSSASDGMSELTPVFNEWFRDYIREADDLVIRLDYITETDQLFVQVMDSTSVFIRTFVLSVKLDKWGEFNEMHRGIVRFSGIPGDYGWVDRDGYGHRIDDVPFVEQIDGTLRGLESEIVLGYIRPAAGSDNADQAFELQEILVGARKTLISDNEMIFEDWNGPTSFVSYNTGFYQFDTDLNGFGVDYYDINSNTVGEDVDWNDGPAEIVDHNDTVAGQRDFDANDSGYPDFDENDTPDGGINTDYLEDWGFIELLPAGGGPLDEDWHGELSLFNEISYGIKVNFSLDGYEKAVEVIPSLAIAKPERDLWTLLTWGHEHKLTFTANQPWEKFSLTSLAITVHLAGQYS